MNKKLLGVVSAVVIGTVMLGASAYASITTATGYDTFKNAVKKTITAKNFTVKSSASLSDNGNILIKGEALSKIDKANKAMSSTVTVTVDNKTEGAAIYKQEQQRIVKLSSEDTYRVMEQRDRKPHKNYVNHNDAQEVENAETIIDAALGSITNNFIATDNADGTKTISLSLNESQIPALANAAVTVAVKNASSKQAEKHPNQPALASSLKDKLPVLTTEIKLKSVSLQATITKDELIKDKDVVVVLSGKDANGASHEVVLKANADISAYNSTIADTIDLTGKTVKQMEHKKGMRGMH